MDMKRVEPKWQEKWQETDLYRFDASRMDKKKYILEMFSYPSAARLHVGHWYNYGPSDTYARLMKMQGYEVFEPMGFDAFGLPAENYAIATGIHPQDSTLQNIETMERQLKAMGGMFNWDAGFVTCDPGYYKWTQWCFLKLYEHGLATRKQAPVNYCEHCNTVLANEQVIDGACERCHNEVVKKNLTQWFFKITDYAQELLDDLDKIDWPEKTKAMQRNWIGRSQGASIFFDLVGLQDVVEVYTTRADTLYGCTYMVLAPEHPLVDRITTPEQRGAVTEYQQETARHSEIERLSTADDKTGVFTGAYAVNPINGREVPVWIADYVLYSYGTGAVMAVPAHDVRDYAFAQKYHLPIERVIKGREGADDTLPFVEYGVLVDSGAHTGITSEQGMNQVVEQLRPMGKGDFKVNYRLRDWLISRQRYWGAPIPMIHCEHCGIVPVPEKDLPVLLPYDVDFTPDGTSPLLKSDAFINVDCPKCGAPARRDPDTMDTFVCSSWYFLRYPDNKNEDEAWSPERINKMLPVDTYIGGPEHACMHLLYARFFTKAFRDMGYLNFDEPFAKLVHQGIILGPDGNRMSKSRGNVISPDVYIEKYGADVFRMYLMFGFSYEEGGPWNDDSIKAVHRYMERVERLIPRFLEPAQPDVPRDAQKQLNYARHYAIQHVRQSAGRFEFNSAIARMMELTNALYKYPATDALYKETVRDLTLLMAPFAPHFAEELWEMMGQPYSIFNQPYPEADASALRQDIISLGVQINGKVRGRVGCAADAAEAEIRAQILGDPKLKTYFEGRQIVKCILIQGKLVNFVVK